MSTCKKRSNCNNFISLDNYHPENNQTGTGYTGKANSPLLGIFEGRAIYLLYNGILKDLTEQGGNILTKQVYDVLPKFDGGKVIYAAANRLGVKAKRENITFKQTPYALEV